MNSTDASTPTRGPFFCFERRHEYDLLIAGAKVAGSAQHRTHSAVLQHGSIVLGNRYDQQQIASLPMPFEQCVERMCSAFPAELAQITDLEFVPGEWSPEELETAGQLMEKYATRSWTQSRDREGAA